MVSLHPPSFEEALKMLAATSALVLRRRLTPRYAIASRASVPLNHSGIRVD